MKNYKNSVDVWVTPNDAIWYHESCKDQDTF